LTDLLDVNLLVSLAWPNHIHHRPALAWFSSRRGQPWVTTPFTEAGFVRVSSNSSANSAAVTPGTAIAMLSRIRQVPGHQFLIDDIPLIVGSRLPPERMATHRQVTDAHLLALARNSGIRLATLDRGIATLAEGEDLMLVPTS
jgi:uncharacterized protein